MLLSSQELVDSLNYKVLLKNTSCKAQLLTFSQFLQLKQREWIKPGELGEHWLPCLNRRCDSRKCW